MEKLSKNLKEINNYIKKHNVQGSVLFRSENSHLVRSGRNQISLNFLENNSKFSISLQDGKRQISGSINTGLNDLTPLKQLVDGLLDRLPFMPEIPFLTPMGPMAQDKFVMKPKDNGVYNFNSQNMVDLFKELWDRYYKYGVEVSGAFSAGGYTIGIIDTLVEEPLVYDGADFNVECVLQLTKNQNKEARSAQCGEQLSHYQPEKIIEELDRTVDIKLNTPREDIDPGTYDVVFDAKAFGEIAAYMSYLTFCGESYEYQTGMLQKGKQGLDDEIFGTNVNITDDPYDQEVLFGRPFGLNGMKRSATTLISQGVLKSFYYSDKLTCDRFNKKVNNDFSVASLKLWSGKGPSTFPYMAKSCKNKTIYIPYLHYMNFTDRSKGEFTGTGRFGAYLIESGKVKAHLFKPRINDSFFNIFNNIEWLSNDNTHVNISHSYGQRLASSISCPNFVKVNNVHITGTNAKTS